MAKTQSCVKTFITSHPRNSYIINQNLTTQNVASAVNKLLIKLLSKFLHISILSASAISKKNIPLTTVENSAADNCEPLMSEFHSSTQTIK